MANVRPGSDFKLSESVRVSKYKALERDGDREALGKFIQDRFEERYFRPALESERRHGFGLMAIACLVLETLESFYQGLPDTLHQSRRMFRDFFRRPTQLSVFGEGGDWFFEDIRCGILHQAESRDGWRIKQTGPLIDTTAKTINALEFVLELRNAVADYAGEIQRDEASWELFKTKMAVVCSNCESPDGPGVV
jgi:hypothetical protein